MNKNFFAYKKTDREWVLDYLSLGKGIIPYEMVQRPDSLDIAPEKGTFFFLIMFTLASKIQQLMTKNTKQLKNFISC